MFDKRKINYVELTGNLVSDPKIDGKWTYVRIATYNGYDKTTGEVREAQFTNVALYNKNLTKYTKGERVTIKGRLSTIQNKKTGFKELGVWGYSCFPAPMTHSDEEELDLLKIFEEPGVITTIGEINE